MNPRPVTAGFGPTRYSLYVPFGYGKIHRLDHFGTAKDGWATFPILGKEAHVIAEEHLAVLRVFGFESEDDATAAFLKIASGFLHAVVEGRASARAGQLLPIYRGADDLRDRYPREYYEPWAPRNPETDGSIAMMGSYVLPEHERILLSGGGIGEIVKPINPAELNKWVDAGDAGKRVESPKVRLALKLVDQANGQRVPELEYLSLVRALEVLKEDLTLGAVPTALVAAWKDQTEQELQKARDQNDARLEEELTDISNRLDFSSITNGIRRLTDGVPLLPTTDPGMKELQDLRGAVGRLYGIRSDLVHDGEVKKKGKKTGQERLMEALLQLRYLVYCVLADRI